MGKIGMSDLPDDVVLLVSYYLWQLQVELRSPEQCPKSRCVPILLISHQLIAADLRRTRKPTSFRRAFQLRSDKQTFCWTGYLLALQVRTQVYRQDIAHIPWASMLHEVN